MISISTLSDTCRSTVPWDSWHGHRKATQKVVKGGALNIGKNGVLTVEAEEGIALLEERWTGLTAARK